MFGEHLFQLNPVDLQKTPLQAVISTVRATDTGVAGIANAIYTVPDGFNLVLTHAHATFFGGTTGAGTSVTTGLLTIRTPEGSDITTLAAIQTDPTGTLLGPLYGQALPVTDITRLFWDGEIILPPKWQVAVLAQFSAGDLTNSSRVGVAGLLIPKGNVALG